MKGFTLIEMIMVVAIFSFIIGITFYFLIIGKDSLGMTNTQVSLQQDLRRCLRRMADELSESSVNYLKDQSESSLNFIQRDEVSETLKCLPENEECVYSSIKFKKPTSWDSQGEITAWSDYITYAFGVTNITRQEGGIQELLIDNINLINKESGHGYTNDPNAVGSGFERLAANRLKISIVAERDTPLQRQSRVEIGSIVYLRN